MSFIYITVKRLKTYKVRGTEHNFCCSFALQTPLTAGVTDRQTGRQTDRQIDRLADIIKGHWAS